MSAPHNLILALRDRSGFQRFIETGTNNGDTAAWASEHFTAVVTIEAEPTIHGRAVHRLGSCRNVRTVRGDSVEVLKEALHSNAPKIPSIFWLDAHWGGGDNAGKERECPVMEEIGLINQGHPNHIILVDDARLFLAPPPIEHNPDHWPDVAMISYALWNKGGRYVAVVDGVFVAVPLGWKAWLIKYLRGEM